MHEVRLALTHTVILIVNCTYNYNIIANTLGVLFIELVSVYIDNWSWTDKWTNNHANTLVLCAMNSTMMKKKSILYMKTKLKNWNKLNVMSD